MMKGSYHHDRLRDDQILATLMHSGIEKLLDRVIRYDKVEEKSGQ
jgi:hypothetical protein